MDHFHQAGTSEGDGDPSFSLQPGVRAEMAGEQEVAPEAEAAPRPAMNRLEEKYGTELIRRLDQFYRDQHGMEV